MKDKDKTKDQLMDKLAKMHQQIAEMKKADIMLMHSDKVLFKEKIFSELIINSLPGIFYLFNEQGKILRWNKNLVKVTGYSSQEIEALRVIDLFAEEDKKTIADRIREVPEKGKVMCEGHLITKDGTRIPYFFTGEKITIDNETYFAGTGTDITDRRRAEEAILRTRDELEIRVKERTLELEESNAALKVLLKQRENDRKELENNIMSNMKQLIFPFIKKLKKSRAISGELAYLNIIESNLKEIISPFTVKLSSKYLGFTPTEIQIADLVKNGKQDKDIIEILSISLDTVKTHRKNIRKKIGISGKKINLRTKLLSFTE
jgi:PAS domain S-box-containing protein